jgi:uncharacterized protein CbrC (UPF0167 family)
MYLFADWRKLNKLDHYNVICNFAGDVGSSYSAELNTRHEDVQRLHFNHYWNTIYDWIAKMKAVKS